MDKIFLPFTLIFLFILFFLGLLIKGGSPKLPQPVPVFSPTVAFLPTATEPLINISQIAQIKAVEDINDLDLSPNEEQIYIPSFDENIIYVIDAREDSVAKKLTVEAPAVLAVSPQDGALYVAGGPGKLMRIDPISGKVEPWADFGQKISDLLFDKEGNFLFAVDSLADSVAVFSPPENKLLAIVPVGREPRAAAALGNFLYTTLYGESGLSVISLDSLSEVARLTLEGRPTSIVAADKLYIADSFGNQILVFDPKLAQITAKIAVDQFPQGLFMDEKERKLYVASFARNSLTVIDLTKDAVEKVIPTATAFTASGGFNRLVKISSLRKFYLTNTLNGKVLVYKY